MSNRFLSLVFLILFSTIYVHANDVPDPANAQVRHFINVPKDGLANFFKWHPMRVPLVSHHRGGPAPGFPENSIEAMDNALKYGPGLMEIDVAQLNDGTLVLMHDRTLGRTTTGKGQVTASDWQTAGELYLKDENGKVTPFRVPTLKTVLQWAKGKTILTLDIKRGTDFKKVADLVAEQGAGDYVVAIAYTLEQAQAIHAIAPTMPITISMHDKNEIEAVRASGINPEQVIAWTGTKPLPKEHYEAIHKLGWTVFMGTLGPKGSSIDAQLAKSGNNAGYLALYQQGIDVIATDRFWAVQKVALNPYIFVFERSYIEK
jgi:glycerophosphoryl diester phosphodiesterase